MHHSLEQRDYLTALPPELIHEICDHLFTTHNPDEGAEWEARVHGPDSDPKALFGRNNDYATHLLDYLAATCKSLRRQLMTWGRTKLHKYQSIAKYTPIRSARLQNSVNYLRGAEHGFLSWAEIHCNFCGIELSYDRYAILMSGITCCKACDQTQWPGKITKEDAKRKYKLRDDQLLQTTNLTPSLARLLSRHPGNLPKLRYGTVCGTLDLTYYFLERDVAAFAKLAHGDLRAHLAKKRVGTDDERQSSKRARQDAVAASEQMSAEQGPAPAETPCSGPAGSVDLVHGGGSLAEHGESGIEWLEESDRDHPYRMPFENARSREPS